MIDIEDINGKNVEYDVYSTIISDIIEWIKVNKNDDNIRNLFQKHLQKLIRNTLKQCSTPLSINKSVLVKSYRHMLKTKQLEHVSPDIIDALKVLLQKKPSRNISGITSVTLLTSPHPHGQSFSCKHDCFYCPNEPAHEGNKFQEQPRSYLYNEPAVRRANENGFLAIDQMLSRLNTLFVNGHEIDKLEIILEGGTYTEYPPEYLEEFHRDIFYTANTFFDDEPKRMPLSIEEETKINESTKVHIIGICIETRPDAINDEWVRRFRKWGVTRIQIGVQHTDNYILKKINRGHTIEQVLDCMQYLKDNCFKIDIHAMPDLPYSTPTGDIEMFDYVYSKIHPDQMKIYPCEITPWTKIKQWYDEGKYTPYSEKNMLDLIDVIKYGMEKCPAHVRLPRVIRDIPISYIVAGNPHSNLRQMIDDTMLKEGKWLKDIRSREIGRKPQYYKKKAKYTVTRYEANGGIDYFIQYQSVDEKALFGFIRLRFPSKNHDPVFSVLKNKALIRELHVYGTTNTVGTVNSNGVQHTGIGTNLLKIAERIAFMNFYRGIVVISGEGVKQYYKKRGYDEVDTFMVKTFYDMKVLFGLFCVILCIAFQNLI